MNGSPICPQCGQAFAEFQQSGLLGCAGCYPTFEKELVKIFKRLHGTTLHCVAVVPQTETRADLEKQLKDAVAREAYEDASAIRDRILASEKQQL